VKTPVTFIDLTVNTTERVLEAVKSAFVACPEAWEEINFLDLLHHVGDQIHIPTGVFMKTMRHALTGLKVRYLPAVHHIRS